MPNIPNAGSGGERQDETFGQLLEKHLAKGTRPPTLSSAKPKPWGKDEFARACGARSSETVRLWRQDESRPRKIEPVLDALFGDDPESDTPQYAKWRAELEQAWLRAASPNSGHIATASPKPLQPATMYGVPPPNPDFTGRENDLKALHAILCHAENPKAITPAAVFGMGGVGKTSLVTAYAYRHITDYAGVWWAPAENRTALLASLAQLGAVLNPEIGKSPDLELAAKRTLALLAESERPWLLIYDNVPTPADIRGLLAGGHTRFLISTRWANWAGLAKELELDLWPEDTAIEFLVRRVKNTSVGDARRLVSALGCLPLAIDHAAAYLRHTGASVTRYLWRLRELMAEPPISADYPRSIYATFTLAVAHAASECDGAEELLSILAVLAPERVPLWLVENFIADDIVRNRAIAMLSLVSLIRHDPIDDSRPAIIIHRLVQAVMRERLRAQTDTLETVGNRAITAVVGFFPEEPFRAIAEWPQCEVLAPHGLHLLKLSETARLDPDTYLPLGYRLGRFLHGRSQLRQAAEVYYHTVLGGRSAVGCDHPLVMKVIAVFANLFRDAGKFRYAEPLARASIILATQKYGRVHQAVAEYVNGLATLLRDIKRFSEARACFDEAIAIAEEAFGKASFRVATYTNNFGVLLFMEQTLDRAEEKFRSAIAIGEAERGKRDVDVETWRHNLAQVLVARHKYSEARKLMNRLMPVLKEGLGAKHPNYLRSRVTLAKILLVANKPDDAFIEANAAVMLYELKKDHPWTRDAAMTTACALVALNRDAEAVDLCAKYALDLAECASR
ncbi:MAG: ATP-binding protein [Rhodoblastus sp.]|nr:ATP-binding protein [Rhodoblastus sp.]